MVRKVHIARLSWALVLNPFLPNKMSKTTTRSTGITFLSSLRKACLVIAASVFLAGTAQASSGNITGSALKVGAVWHPEDDHWGIGIGTQPDVPRRSSSRSACSLIRVDSVVMIVSGFCDAGAV
ncbi:MAG: hypothetical protein EOP52_13015 [Sphingobacteriales bacterium]|nr:MAG: hypothetical protein EOP52_13015 [Sphingobacteriales bacterium]